MGAKGGTGTNGVIALGAFDHACADEGCGFAFELLFDFGLGFLFVFLDGTVWKIAKLVALATVFFKDFFASRGDDVGGTTDGAFYFFACEFRRGTELLATRFTVEFDHANPQFCSLNV